MALSMWVIPPDRAFLSHKSRIAWLLVDAEADERGYANPSYERRYSKREQEIIELLRISQMSRG